MSSAVPQARSRRWCSLTAQVTLLTCALGGCSVYSDDLLDADALDPDGAGNSTSSGGKSGGSGGSNGKLTGSGGKSGSGAAGSSVVPSSGAGGTDAEGGGMGDAGSSSGGSGGGGNESGGPGAGGTGNTGGSESSAGSGAGGTPPVTLPGDLVDGFEDVDLTLEQTAGRGGLWYLFDDGTVGKAGPAPLACSPLSDAPAELGAYAMHITATGFTSWGSGLGVDFRAGKKVYDGSKHTGIRFWARVGEGKNTRHRVQLADGTTDALGGVCNPAVNAPNGEKCEDHFGSNLTFTTTWTQYVLPFSSLSQIGWGTPAAAIDKSTLYSLQITAKAKLEVDLWLDQIEFF